MSKDILYPLRRLHGMIYEKRLRHARKKEYRNQFLEIKKNNPKTVFFVLTPEHENMGDHAIAYAVAALLEQNGIKCMEVPIKLLYEWKYQKILDTMNGFPILINGGGNLGTLWFSIEELQRDIIQNNPQSPIFILPNTIFYEANEWGNSEFKKSKQIYNHHKKLYLYSREQLSFDIMKPAYKNVKLIPDMVLSLPHYSGSQLRKGCLLCLRSDRERTRTEQQEQIIREQAERLFVKNVVDTDMLAEPISAIQREAAVRAKLNEFCGAELVITDRLHGMIFCAITGTPCIVVDSKSPKVRGCFEWIKHLDYIRFADAPEDIVAEYQAIPKGPHYYDNPHLMPYYKSLAEDIQNIWR